MRGEEEEVETGEEGGKEREWREYDELLVVVGRMVKALLKYQN